jgi:hypothetical protein
MRGLGKDVDVSSMVSDEEVETKYFGQGCEDVSPDEVEIGWMLRPSAWGTSRTTPRRAGPSARRSAKGSPGVSMRTSPSSAVSAQVSRSSKLGRAARRLLEPARRTGCAFELMGARGTCADRARCRGRRGRSGQDMSSLACASVHECPLARLASVR